MTLLAAWSPLAVLDAVWPYLIMLAGFSAIIFVHELGHFLVAKWAGVRVDRFAIGFGREIIGFTKGETRYSFNVLPLGGYVKMLGQEDFDDKAKELQFNDNPRSFVNKSIGRRMAIVSAGVIMNTLFAFFLFMIVFLIGMKSIAPRISFVKPDSPADRAGLQPGDLVREVNGERVLEFNDITFAVVLAPPNEPIEFVVERDDGLHTVPVTPELRAPEGTRDIQRLMVGIGYGHTPEIIAVGPEIDTTRPDRPRVGDILAEIDGTEVTADNASAIFELVPYAKEIHVDRPDPDDPDAPPKRMRVDIPPVLAVYPADIGDLDSVSVLGLAPLVRVRRVDEKGRAALGGLEAGDTILSWADVDLPTRAQINRAEHDYPERDIPYEVRKTDGRVVSGFVRPKRNKRGAATVQAHVRRIAPEDRTEGGPKARFAEVRPGGLAATAGIERGNAILKLHGVTTPSHLNVARLIRENAHRRLPFTVRKADGSTHSGFVKPEPPGSLDANYSFLAEDLLQVGRIVPTTNDRPSPAALAGITPGALIEAVNGQPVSTWRELIQSCQTHAGADVELTYVDRSGERRVVPFPIPHSLRTLLGLGPQGRIVRIDGKEKVPIGPRKELVTVRYHEGTRTALANLIGQRQVPIEYRANPLAELQTAYVDVTEDMVDPWLGRIAFAPNIRLDDETVILKGEGAVDAMMIGMHKTYRFMRQVYELLHRMIFTRSVSVQSITGPLGIVSFGGKVARSGPAEFLFFMAIISANLAVINFLPLPIVDGGLMVFLIIEKIKGSPISLRVQIATQMLGLFLLISAFVYFTYQDALRLLG